ncbi:RNA polymerase sigma factor SigJ [Actinoallomurus rhizosphaericola]|uniref:RNA polymerase sigma factor SigJ n=1 Tax=Actinoallomurus rhizosphaericola TaxID=2952536 RepID=UPI002093EE97|nr:RNA polymerase sigma factor SigJ [Actinoallomurus rhizosphaericola]MCO5998297.1 RNA polymerase sigma factor SigJ [Actinoallomurus rhizosphaericola]
MSHSPPDPAPDPAARDSAVPDAAVPDAAAAAEWATRAFVDHRELLFSVVYTMLGSVADTEDVLQETWLAWHTRSRASGGEPIANPRAYLVRVAVNGALARQTSISRRREEYVGPWLPEPIATAPDTGAADAADGVLRAESVSMALLVVLETLSPLERAVFVLHEVFGYSHPETAAALGRSTSAIRQLAHRAREHVHARRPRYEADSRVRRQVTERFIAAVTGGDIQALIQVLSPDVTLWADGGGKARAAGPRPVRGRERIARLIVGDAARHPIPGLTVRYQYVNGDPSAVLLSGGAVHAVVVLDLTADGTQVSGIYTVTNPDKLSHLG